MPIITAIPINASQYPEYPNLSASLVPVAWEAEVPLAPLAPPDVAVAVVPDVELRDTVVYAIHVSISSTRTAAYNGR